MFLINKKFIKIVVLFSLYFSIILFKPVTAQQLKFGSSNMLDIYIDEIYIVFDPTASFDVDSYDAAKLWNSEPSMPNLYTAIGPALDPYQINALPVLDDTTIYLTVGFMVKISDNYHIRLLEQQSIPVGAEVVLIDSTLHIHTDMLGASPDYSFYQAANYCLNCQSQWTGRFYLKIYFPSSTLGVKTKNPQPAPFCRGEKININYTATGTFNPGNVFTAQISDASGNFNSPTNIGSLNSTTSGVINATIPLSIPTGSGYRVRVNSSNPFYIGTPNSADMKIGTKPNVTYSGVIPAQCLNNPPLDLFSVGTVSPLGGTFEGAGVSNNIFYPAIAGIAGSPHVISYIYSDFAGCADTAYNNIIVHALPNVTFTGTLQPQCENSTSYDLVTNAVVSPQGGYFSGIGVNNNNFNASSVPSTINSVTIYYIYTDGNGCTDTASNNIIINDLPTVSITNLDPLYCNYNTDVILTGSPLGGNFTIDGIIGNTLSPSSIGLGTHTVIYSYTDNNLCTNSQTEQFFVDECLAINYQSNNIKDISIYPNPADDLLNITFNKSGNYKITLQDTRGLKIYETNAHIEESENHLAINIDSYLNGIYFLKIENIEKVNIYKVIIK